MRYAVMSDAHANPWALECALDSAKKRGCDKFVYLGDSTGYGYDAQSTVDIVRTRFDHAVIGNHDAVCIGMDRNRETMLNHNYDIDRMQRNELSKENLEFLGNLPFKVSVDGLFDAVHGDFINPPSWWYIFEGYEADLNFKATEGRLMFCGHTHHLSVFVQRNGESSARLYNPGFDSRLGSEKSKTIRLSKKSRYILNCGSVGYPRNDGFTSYAIYDSDKDAVELVRMPFDYERYINQKIAAKSDVQDWVIDDYLSLRSGK